MEANDNHAPETMQDPDLTRLLGGITSAEAGLDRAALTALGAARGRGWSWPRIGTTMGLTADGARDRFDRASSRHPDYVAPLPPTLSAHITRADDLVGAIADPPQGFTRHAANRLLGALLLTTTLERAPELAAHWLTDPELTGAAAAATRHPRAKDALRVLTDYARERPGTRADLLDILREAVQGTTWMVGPSAPAAPGLPASGSGQDTAAALLELAEAIRRRLPDLAPGPAAQALRALDQALHIGAPTLVDQAMATLAALDTAERAEALGPAGEGLWQRAHRDRATDSVHTLFEDTDTDAENAGPSPASETAPGSEEETSLAGPGPALPRAAAVVEPGQHDPEPAPARRPGYARPLERAGLSPAAADALAEPLTQLIGEVTLVSHREVNPQTRHLMEALHPTLISQRPARVRTLLHLLPRLDLYGLNEWAPLALAISKHAPHLELLPSATDLLTAADLPTHLADDVNAVVNGARRALVASWAPTAPAWEAGPALEQLTAAVEGGHADRLAAALDAAAELDHVQIAEHAGLGTHQHGHRWEDLAHAWRQVRPVTPAAPTWPLLAAKVFPDAAMAEAVAHLLDVSGHPLHTGALGAAETHRALDALRTAVLHGQTASLGTVLDDVLKLKPTREPASAFPEIADALRRLIHAYDQ